MLINPPREERMLRAGDAARFLGVVPQTLRRWATNGNKYLPFTRLGPRGDKYYKESDLIKLRDGV